MATESLIVTLTANPSVDLGCEAEAVRPVRKIRTRNERFDPGGGGVNVSRVVRELGGETLAVVLVGGVTGRFIEELIDGEGVPRRSVPIAGRTRISQIVQDLSSGLEYRFVPEGPVVAEAEWHATLATLEELGTPSGWLVLSGSLPRGMPEDFFARAAAAARARGQRVVVDSSGAPMRAAIAGGGLELIKPSLGEFEALLGRKLPEGPEQEAAALAFARSGAARLVAVTLGHRGAVLASAERVWRLPAPDVPVRGASGAGDSFVAAMTLALARGAAPEEAFAWGSAAGGATVAQSGTAHAKRAQVEAIYAQLRPQLDR
ncbi:1-phosphofructokinase family hexose kinase [Falsiroseomonas tokyonensis]|uniref:Phosphofructokinase n=1 Tax=Falsiroseomonas tokyonensis TaxID=430521 RepID=A0ABV7BVJ6_9PROT|nr:1-phosphofructokinase family hexose kinase [Falsiroseomonas tokyonensis]MBU8539280.1 1-phosphofructokinase family hexose kinase [Falsiroseomonas tokyonensis]